MQKWSALHHMLPHLLFRNAFRINAMAIHYRASSIFVDPDGGRGYSSPTLSSPDRDVTQQNLCGWSEWEPLLPSQAYSLEQIW